MEQNGQKVMILFSEYVKVTSHDPSSYWSSKLVHMIIVPSLCALTILGLLFSSCNDIMVDASAWTVIDKKCNFNLLHPMAPPPPAPPKQKLQELFKELQADCKLMVTELNMVCFDRR